MYHLGEWLAAPTTAEVAIGGVTIHMGQQGESVGDVQMMLMAVGHPVVVDEMFGLETQTAVQAFQRDMGLPASGQVDRATLTALRASESKRSKSGGLWVGLAVLAGLIWKFM